MAIRQSLPGLEMMVPTKKLVVINASVAAGLLMALLGDSEILSVGIAGILLFGVANAIIWMTGRRKKDGRFP